MYLYLQSFIHLELWLQVQETICISYSYFDEVKLPSLVFLCKRWEKILFCHYKQTWLTCTMMLTRETKSWFCISSKCLGNRIHIDQAGSSSFFCTFLRHWHARTGFGSVYRFHFFLFFWPVSRQRSVKLLWAMRVFVSKRFA